MAVGARELAVARSIARTLLTDTCEILRGGTEVPDGAGGYTQGPAVAATVPCRVVAGSATPREVMEGGRTAAVTLWWIELPWGTDVRPTDRLRVGGREYEVADDNDPETDAVTLSVSVRLVR